PFRCVSASYSDSQRDHSHRRFLFLGLPSPPRSTLFPYTTLFRSLLRLAVQSSRTWFAVSFQNGVSQLHSTRGLQTMSLLFLRNLDRKSTRLNSSHVSISYAVFCLKKKNNILKHYDSAHIYTCDIL